jgi:outer membrane protein assembly factor BamD (BamD/ComL family)
MRIHPAALFLAITSNLAFAADKPPSGDMATVIVVSPIYVGADTSSNRLDQMTPGRELLVIEHSGKWVRVFANTDSLQNHDSDAPVLSSEERTPPVAGWMEDKGLVTVKTPKGAEILYGVAVQAEKDASEAHAPERAAQDARLLYSRVALMFPQSPLAPEAYWRSADIKWQIDKADISSLPSAHEKENYLRPTINEDLMRKIQKMYPNSKWSDLAAWDMLDNQVCGDWQGSTKCPEKEAQMYEKYADQRPDSSKAPQALYEAAYRLAAAGDIYAGSDDRKKADFDRGKAIAVANKLESKYPQSEYADRAAGLVFKIEQSIPVYGITQDAAPN